LSAADEASTPDSARSGGRESLDRMMPEVYHELRAIAHRQLAARFGGGTLSTTGLVHEAYLKLAAGSRSNAVDKGHFIALSALAMRHVLVDRAKARFAGKREGMRQQVTLDDALIPSDDQPEVLLQLHEAIDRLAIVEPRLARIVECRFFGGFSEEEIAEALGVTTRTVQRDWAKARMLLRRALQA
jgi:RNA polymerase sigma factor (TIGR02999 family)